MGLVWLALLGLLIELCWLALWSLSGALSHSPAFNSAFLADHAAARALFEITHTLARALLPDLSGAPLGEPPGARVYNAPATALAAVFVWLAAAYAAALVLLNRGIASRAAAVWVVVIGAVVFQATLLFLPGLFSQDVFGYIAYGRLSATYELNPYIWPPSSIAKDAVVAWVTEVWRAYPSPYGPAWLDVQWAMARLFGNLAVPDQALAYRLFANGLLLANLSLLWSLLGRVTSLDSIQRTTALAALAWNPLVLFEVAGNAHNDVLMIGFTLLALVLLVRTQNSVLAGASFTLGALVKYLSGLGLIWLVVADVARSGFRTSRWRWRAMLVAFVSAAIVLGVAVPWLELPDSLEPLRSEAAGVGYVNSLPDRLALTIANRVLVPMGAPASQAHALARGWERVLALAAFGAYLVWELRRVWKEPNAAAVARACARSSLVYVLVASMSVQTWYFCLPVAVACTLGWRARLTQVAIGYSLVAMPALYLNYYLRDSVPVWVTLVYGLAPLLPLARKLTVPYVWRRDIRCMLPGEPDEAAVLR